MSTERKLIVGLADEAVGRRVANVLANVSAGTNRLGFFGSAATQQQGVTLSNVTSVAQALINLGLATQNT